MNVSKYVGLGLLALAIGFTGCGPKEESGAYKSTKPAKKKGHSHDHDHSEGPHGGVVTDFGKYHVEFTVDHGKKQATVYILDDSMKKAVPATIGEFKISIKSPNFQVDLKADPLEGETKEKASRYTATHDSFGKEQEFEGTFSGVIEGKPYTADFEEEEHKDHDHGKKEEGKKK
jgi:hypothetical protein